MATSVFADIQGRSFPYVYHGRIHVDTLVGGTPSDQNVAKGWLETKLKGVNTTEQIERMVTETMLERKVTADEALEIVNKLKNLSGFKRGSEPDHEDQLYYEGRQLKAALKEAVSVAVSVNKIKQQGWGQTRKWISGFFPEHVFIRENKLYLTVDDKPITEATGILQQFVHTRFGSSIQYQEQVDNAEFDFTVVADYLFTDAEWAMIWSTGEWNGLGASRSQGYGTYQVVQWEKDFSKAAEADLRKLEEQHASEEEEEGVATVVRTNRKKAKVA